MILISILVWCCGSWLVKIFIEPSPVPPLTPFTHLLHLPCLSWSTVFALRKLKYQQPTLELCCPAGSYHPCHHLRLLPLLLVALMVPLLLSCLSPLLASDVCLGSDWTSRVREWWAGLGLTGDFIAADHIRAHEASGVSLTYLPFHS